VCAVFGQDHARIMMHDRAKRARFSDKSVRPENIARDAAIVAAS
jgi:hypothetical protein